jgi:hypothetical protein
MDKRQCLTEGCTQKTNAGKYMCSKCLVSIAGKTKYLLKHCQVKYAATPTPESCKASVKLIIDKYHAGKAGRAFDDEEWDLAANYALFKSAC